MSRKVIIFLNADIYELVHLDTDPELYLKNRAQECASEVIYYGSGTLPGADSNYSLCDGKHIGTHCKCKENPLIMQLTESSVPGYGPLIVEKFIDGNRVDCTIEDVVYLKTWHPNKSIIQRGFEYCNIL